MYYLTDICFMCLKNNIKLQSVFIQDNDGIFFNEKLRYCFLEIINSTPDAHKLACLECLEKLRFLYDIKQSDIRTKNLQFLSDFKQSAIYSNTVVRNYVGKLQSEDKTRQQLSVVLPARKRRKKLSSKANFPDIKVNNIGNNFKIKNLNLNFTNKEQLNTVDHSCQPTANKNVALSTTHNCLTEKNNLETKIVKKVVPVTDTENIYVKQKPKFFDDNSTKIYLNKEAEDSEGNTSNNKDDSDFELSEEGTNRPNNYNNQKVNTIPLKPLYVSDDSIKFCNTCQELLFEDLNNLNVHLCTHIQSTNCSRCEDSLEGIYKYQRHMFNHCETIFEILDKGEHGEKFLCALCSQQFDEISNLTKHILDKHISSLKCVVCSRAFSIKPNLLRHILDKHCHIKIYKCKICPSQFTGKEPIKDHMIKVHYSDKVCICQYCCQKFRNSKVLREHISKYHEEDLRVHEDITRATSTQDEATENLCCAICHQQFNNAANLKKHLYYNHIDSLKCEICCMTCTKESGLVKHILVTHCNVKQFECLICSKKFIDKLCFKRHMNRSTHNGRNKTTQPKNKTLSSVLPVTLVNGQKATCTICHKQFDTFESLKQHIYDEHITGLDCVVCSKTYTARKVLNRHIMEQHCCLKIINCKLCPQRFAWKESFKYHMNQHHSGDRVGAITELNYEVGAVTELDKKVAVVPELEEKFSAVLEQEEIFIKEEQYYSDEYNSSDEEDEADNYEIEKDFSNIAMAEESNSYTSTSSNLEESIGSSVIPNTTATTTASYCESSAPVDQSDVCAICHKMFLYLSNISEHLNAHMQESSCSMCNDSAENISRLQRHMLTPCGNTNISHDSANTTNTRTNEKVTCVVCQREFKYIILKKHMRNHITNSTCVVCNKTLINKISLRRHLVDHCNFKPFQCEVCDKKYSGRQSLKHHMNVVHYSRVVCCQHCQKTLKGRKSLHEHIKTMHPELTYRCEVCKWVFLQKNKLEKHAKLHTLS